MTFCGYAFKITASVGRLTTTQYGRRQTSRWADHQGARNGFNGDLDDCSVFVGALRVGGIRMIVAIVSMALVALIGFVLEV
jgi:hypothetical protein